jgi:hypothetical protein
MPPPAIKRCPKRHACGFRASGTKKYTPGLEKPRKVLLQHSPSRANVTSEHYFLGYQRRMFQWQR